MNKNDFRASLLNKETRVIDRQGNTVAVTELVNFLNDQKGYKLHEVGQRTYLVTPINIEPQRFGLEESFIVLLSLQKPEQTSPICFAPETTNDHTKQIAGL